MYNRYIRSDNGSYVRVPQEEPQSCPSQHTSETTPPRAEETPPRQPPPRHETQKQSPKEEHHRRTDSLTGILRHALDQLHLDSVDTGDLLLLGLLFFLFREDADEELLTALGLLLIL